MRQGAAQQLPPTVQQTQHDLPQRVEFVRLPGNKEILPDLGPFSEHLRALGDYRIRLGDVLQVDIGFRKDSHGTWLPEVDPSEPVATFFQDLHRIAHIQWQAITHSAVPVMDG